MRLWDLKRTKAGGKSPFSIKLGPVLIGIYFHSLLRALADYCSNSTSEKESTHCVTITLKCIPAVIVW